VHRDFWVVLNKGCAKREIGITVFLNTNKYFDVKIREQLGRPAVYIT